MTSNNIIEEIRQACWKQAIHSFGTGYIFEKRIAKYNRLLNIIKFVGIGTPLLMGAIVLMYGTDFKYVDIFIATASIILFIQLIISFWALVAKWEDKYSHSVQSTFANYNISWEYEKLAITPVTDKKQLEYDFKIIEAKSREWDRNDYKQEVSDKEKRKGMRAALRNYQRACSGCDEVPKSLKPTNCNICGNF